MSLLLLSPSSSCRPSGDFGDPHLVALGSFVKHRTGVGVEVVDLDYERLLSSPDPRRIFDARFGVVGICCYSSYDYLTAFYLGREIRRHNPEAVLVVGGYHPSARPDDFLHPPDIDADDPSPFDHVIVGEGELPLARIVEAARRGERLSQRVLGPEPLESLDDLPPLDWSLLGRYRAAARSIGGQVAMSFSRGCPFGCDFCMERAKGQSVWRAFSPRRAERELRALHAWLDLRGWKLFIADAVFGLDADWRREMLDRLARLDLGLAKLWTLTRIDLVGEGDAQRYHAANVGVGLGLESGDADMLKLTGKTHDPRGFLDRFVEFARRAADAALPWGANIIAGHPGETAGSMERSAAFCGRLFGIDSLTGFLCIDPYRFYPGSRIDRNLEWYERTFGTRIHRARWWNYSDQAFTCEWVDPSRELDYRQREALTARLFRPIVQDIARRFAYRGPARDYFLRSVAEAVELLEAPARLRTLNNYHLWRRLTGSPGSSLAQDDVAAGLLREARSAEVGRLASERSVAPNAPLLQALIDEPRERYVPPDRAGNSWRDEPVALDDEGRATVSAIHAYLVNYELLDLGPGDVLLELGGGTGYGAAIASRLVAPGGRVVTVEVDPALAAQARRNLAGGGVEVICADAMSLSRWPSFTKALFAFAVGAIPTACLDAISEGGRLVAPLIDANGRQILTLHRRANGALSISRHGEVRYVPASGATDDRQAR